MLKIKHLKHVYKYLGLSLFFISLLIALITFDGYGMSWDETVQRETGLINYNFVFSNDASLLTWKDKDYGVAFELPLVIIEKICNLTDSRNIYLMRHLVTHFFFLIGCYFIFLLIDYLYKNKLLATVGFLLLVLHPRIYAHSFYNTKDIPFLSMIIICLYYYVKAIDKKSISSFIKLGICVGLLINLRIMGVLILTGTIFTLIIDTVRGPDRKLHLWIITIFLSSSCLTLYLTWPFLWSNPIQNFSIAFANMSEFRWKYTVLFNGELIKATELNWKYIPTWFSITTPIIYLLFGAFGFLFLIYNFLKTPYEFLENSLKRSNLLFLGYLFAPLLAVIILNSVLYDGWRQLFFIYPPFILLSIYGLSYLVKKNTQALIGTLVLVIFTFTLTSTNMIRNFPLQGVYFNEIFSLSSPESLRGKFEMDYWGVSYKQSLEYILKNDSNDFINLSVANGPGTTNLLILPLKERKRFNIVSKDKASYFITNYRWHHENYKEYEDCKSHAIIIGNNTVNKIFKLK